MILILSRAAGETTTDMVCDWLDALGADFFRLNVEDLQYPSRFSYRPNSGELRVEDTASGSQRLLRLADVRVVWYRRWGFFETYHPEHVDTVFEDAHRQYELMRYLSEELRAVGQAVFAGLRHAHWLSGADSSKTDKFRMLAAAADVGLDIPDTIIASSRDALVAFAAEHDRIITKNLGLRPYNVRLSASGAGGYTCDVDAALLQDQAEVFFPSLAQEAIAKRYEIRSFVLGDSVHSMAIFSQNDDQTATDFRRYNNDRPNRAVPYRLPDTVREQLLRLFGELGLQTGSADIIRTTNDRYVFLEINPIGQFGMVSSPCNYDLEKKVAAFLISHAQN